MRLNVKHSTNCMMNSSNPYDTRTLDFVPIGCAYDEEISPPVTSVVADQYAEQIWCGHQDGRIISYTFPELNKYCAIQAHKNECAVVDLIDIESGILSLSSGGVKLHTKGGVPICSFGDDLKEDQKIKFADLVCMKLSHVADNYGNSAERLYVSGESDSIFGFDLNYPSIAIREITLPTEGKSKFIQMEMFSSTTLCLVRDNGKISFVDLRSKYPVEGNTLHPYDGNGIVNQVALQGKNLAVCGMRTTFGSNPQPDQYIQLYDLRMNRGQLGVPRLKTPLRFAGRSSGPAMLAFTNDRPSSLVAVGQDGTCQTFSLQYHAMPTHPTTLGSGDPMSPIVSMNLSQNGQVLLLGDMSGFTYVNATVNTTDLDPPVVSLYGWRPEVPVSKPPPPPALIDPHLMATHPPMADPTASFSFLPQLPLQYQYEAGLLSQFDTPLMHLTETGASVVPCNILDKTVHHGLYLLECAQGHFDWYKCAWMGYVGILRSYLRIPVHAFNTDTLTFTNTRMHTHTTHEFTQK